MENNWHVDNTGCASHLYLDEVPGNYHIRMGGRSLIDASIRQ
jgi:hypothetical protein